MARKGGENAADLRKRLAAATQQLDGYKRRYALEVAEFNAGSEAAERGDPMDESHSEQWQTGYAFFAYDRLLAQVESLVTERDRWRREAETLAERVAAEPERKTEVERLHAALRKREGQERLYSERERFFEAERQKLLADLDRLQRSVDDWMKQALASHEERSVAEYELDRLRAESAALHRELQTREIAADGAANHTKHYRCLVAALKAGRKTANDLGELIGEGPTVANAVWRAYGGEGGTA